MKNQDIVKRIARQSGVSRGEAADRMERVVHRLVAGLRRGRKTSLPGLGTFSAGADGRAQFERERGSDEPQD
jgi:nucleoid DNA-binding protein